MDWTTPPADAAAHVAHRLAVETGVSDVHAALESGHPVREMIGGFEYWAREGLPVETAAGVTRPAVDPLTAPAGVSCGC